MGCNRWSLAYLKQLVKKIGAEASDIEGVAERNEPAFSSEGLVVSLEHTTDGKVKATVTPEGSPVSFFLHMRVK